MKKLTSLVSRGRNVLRRRGAIGAASHAGQTAWNRVARHRQLIYELPREVANQFHAEAPASARVYRYRSIEEIPDDLVNHLTSEHGMHLVPELVGTFKSGATLFLVVYDNRPVSMLWAKRGTSIKRWYLPLGESDVVLYGWHTSPEYRGLNLIGLAMETAIGGFSAQTERFLADVKIWNKPSIRAMEKAGFRFVSKAKPLE